MSVLGGLLDLVTGKCISLLAGKCTQRRVRSLDCFHRQQPSAIRSHRSEGPVYFVWMPHLATIDLAASGTLTRQQLDWNPTGPDLLTDLRSMDYSAAERPATFMGRGGIR
jgi:hypothetical protein